MPDSFETCFSAVFTKFWGMGAHSSCFLSVFHFVFHSVFTVKIFKLVVKTAEKQTEKQLKNATMSIPIVALIPHLFTAINFMTDECLGYFDLTANKDYKAPKPM